MKRLVFSAVLPDELFSELQSAAAERRCSPAQLCAEAIEGLLASRRLPYVTPSPRQAGSVLTETMMRDLGDVVEHRGGRRAGPVDIPSLDELGCLEDIR